MYIFYLAHEIAATSNQRPWFLPHHWTQKYDLWQYRLCLSCSIEHVKEDLTSTCLSSYYCSFLAVMPTGACNHSNSHLMFFKLFKQLFKQYNKYMKRLKGLYKMFVRLWVSHMSQALITFFLLPRPGLSKSAQIPSKSWLQRSAKKSIHTGRIRPESLELESPI